MLDGTVIDTPDGVAEGIVVEEDDEDEEEEMRRLDGPSTTAPPLKRLLRDRNAELLSLLVTRDW